MRFIRQTIISLLILTSLVPASGVFAATATTTKAKTTHHVVAKKKVVKKKVVKKKKTVYKAASVGVSYKYMAPSGQTFADYWASTSAKEKACLDTRMGASKIKADIDNPYSYLTFAQIAQTDYCRSHFRNK